MTVNFKDLETRGFVVIPGFLSSEEIQYFCDDFERQPLDAGNRNYRLTAMSPDANARLTQRATDVIAAVGRQTVLQVDLPRGGSYFATGARRGINFSWHQDHESFFELQNHYDYLNFYIPIVKPRQDKSNLSIVPFDVLERQAPATFRRVVRSGATRFVRMGRWQLVVCDDTGTVHRVRGDLSEMAHTPQLAAGDLLLLRGDVIHRTQDTETERVALSFRASRAGTIVNRRRLAAGGMEKAHMMANNPGPYLRMFKGFDAAGSREVPADRLQELMPALPGEDGPSRRRFMAYLMLEKLRAGVMNRFLFSILGMHTLARIGQAINFYYRCRMRLQRTSVVTP